MARTHSGLAEGRARTNLVEEFDESARDIMDVARPEHDIAPPTEAHQLTSQRNSSPSKRCGASGTTACKTSSG